MRDKAGLRAYLETFFAAYAYTAEDTEVFLTVYDRIAADAESYAILNQIMDLYDESIECDYQKIIDLSDEIALRLAVHEYTAEFLSFVCLSQKAEQVYAARGIAPEIFRGNMYDLKYKVAECRLVYNIAGSFVAMWFAGFFRVKLFALGRLQFELTEFPYHYEKNGRLLTKGSKVINMHIPRSLKPLDEQSCDEAFAMAKEFFKSHFAGETAFYCNSWLLYSENKKFLPEKSNTYKFMCRFDIVCETVDKNLNCLWRICDTMEKNPDRLEAKTSVQRAIKAHLQSGGKLGSAAGVFFL